MDGGDLGAVHQGAGTTHDESTAFYVAHSVLIVVNFAIALVLGRWGWQVLRANRSGVGADRDAVPAETR
ncbi:MAG: hypothetical protein ACJ72E_06405 [Marmoricola sp.]